MKRRGRSLVGKVTSHVKNNLGKFKKLVPGKRRK